MDPQLVTFDHYLNEIFSSEIFPPSRPTLLQRRNSHGQSNRLTNKLSQTNYQTKEPQTTALNVDEKTRNIFGVAM